MTRLTLMGALALALCLGGCDDDSMGDTDAGPGGGTDAGPGGGTDAGPGADTDAGPGGDTDAGPGGDTDAGPGGTDAGGDTDAGPGGMTGVPCGMDTCDATEQCCTTGFLGSMMSTCIPSGDMCMGASRTCDGPEDCGSGEVCCGQRGSGGGISVTVSCVAAAMCEGGGLTGPYELCRDAADCSTSGDMCCPASFVPGVDGFCAEMCTGIGPTP